MSPTPRLVARHKLRERTVVLKRGDGTSWQIEIPCQCTPWQRIYRIVWERFKSQP